MVEITDKHNCCGCSACVQVCPKRCISFEEDSEGFCYPSVDKDVCVNCGLCEQVCPCLNQGTPKEPQKVYAAINPNEEIRMNSSSGGIFTILAERIIEEGGVVFGARFDEKWNVIHDYVETIEELKYFRGSKYVQSRIGNSFQQVLDFLKVGRKVLFSGTPCQISGLKLFLRKDYSNLITVDFICHGVPSPGVFRWYLQERVNKYAALRGKKNSVSSPIKSIPKGDVLLPEGISIKDIRFRDKYNGWKKFSFSLCLAEASAEGKQNTVSLSKYHMEDPYFLGFNFDLFDRPSCHACPSKELKSGSDLMIADFWGISRVLDKFDDDNGTSMILVKTDAGSKIISALKESLMIQEVSYETIRKYNRSVYYVFPEHKNRSKFFSTKVKYGFEAHVRKMMSPSFNEITLACYGRIINKIFKK